MESLSRYLNVNKKHDFKNILFNLNLNKFRKLIYFKILHNNKNDYFDLHIFINIYIIN